MQTTNTSDFLNCYHAGIENHDLEAFMKCYDDNAQVKVVDQNNPPSNPKVLRGKEEIRNFYSDILGRDLKHHIDLEAVSDSVAAFNETCIYPNGTRVVSTDMCELRNGKISSQLTVQAWDH